MGQNDVIVSLAGSIAVIIGIVGLLVRDWINNKKQDKFEPQSPACALEHQKISSALEVVQTSAQATTQAAQQSATVASSAASTLAVIKDGIDKQDQDHRDMFSKLNSIEKEIIKMQS